MEKRVFHGALVTDIIGHILCASQAHKLMTLSPQEPLVLMIMAHNYPFLPNSRVTSIVTESVCLPVCTHNSKLYIGSGSCCEIRCKQTLA